jgi:16S rRNA (adenine1518-N6/adenine1519-N6)-dimethyltransferase
VEGDVLELGRRVNREALALLGDAAFRVASNLPYSAATPFIVSLANSGLPWLGGAVTVQKEVAERLCAPPGSAQYGAATALVACGAECALVRRVPPDVFWPRPKVESAVLRLSPLQSPLVTAAEFEGFATFVRAVFSARRKKLTRALGAAGLDAAAARSALEGAGANADARPGELSPSALVALWHASA